MSQTEKPSTGVRKGLLQGHMERFPHRPGHSEPGLLLPVRPSCSSLMTGICNYFMASVLSAGGGTELETWSLPRLSRMQNQLTHDPPPPAILKRMGVGVGDPEEREARDGAIRGMSSSFVIRQTLCSDLSLPRQSCLNSFLSFSISSVKLNRNCLLSGCRNEDNRGREPGTGELLVIGSP